MNRAFLILIVLSFGQLAQAQPAQTPVAEKSIQEEFKKQISSLYAVRGMPPKEIDSLLRIFDSIDIHSDRDVARVLGAIYPREQQIGILFFFYSGEHLHRVLFEPGQVIEQKDIMVSRDEILRLGNDFNRALGLTAVASTRKPRLRSSIEDDAPPPGALKLEAVVDKASKLLLPQNLDSNYKHLVIIPALNIGSIPFHLLQPYGTKTPLIEKCSFTIAPGLLDLTLMRWKWLKQNGIEVVNLFRKTGRDADEVFFGEKMMKQLQAESKFVVENPLFISNPSYPTHTKYVFPDLPGAKKEVRFATRYLENYKVLDSAAAIKDSVVRLMDGADVAYFATHGVSSAEQPMENSFLVLSGEDPFLTAKDIMSLRNRRALKKFPELVILSACQTGLGKPIEAGIAGLARAFLLGGSNNVIMSLWSVDDEATAFLMSRFFYNLQNIKGNLPAEPLRQAILDTRKKFPHPSQWASFSVFGIDY